jgi:prefoldin subunit 5
LTARASIVIIRALFARARGRAVESWMSTSIEELRKQKERLEKEREDVERQLAEAERRERERSAAHLVEELRTFTGRIDALKEERQQLLQKIREAAPRLGDFTYAADDYRLTLQGARAAMKQPELLDRTLAALAGAALHVEPRTPRFRLFRGLRAVGTLQLTAKRITIAAGEPIIDATILADARALDATFPGLVTVELATGRRVRENVPGRTADGSYATAMTFVATDTGSLDTILPLALRALDHVAAYQERVTPDEELRLFEPVEVPPAPAAPSAPVAA